MIRRKRIDVLRIAPGRPEAVLNERAAKAKANMARFDALPPHLRAVANERGLKAAIAIDEGWDDD